MLRPNSLLDCLTDLDPEARQDAKERRTVSLSGLKQSIQRDLSWLLNATSLSSVQALDSYPYVAESVINYGFQDIAGKTILDLDLDTIAQSIRKMIWAFEPRLIRHTVRVSFLSDQKNQKTMQQRNVLPFLIEGDLRAQLFTERLYFRTELDLEAGQARVFEQGA